MIMPTPPINPARFESRELQVREAALLIFCDAQPKACSELWCLSGNEWQRLLRWLDTSGLALYFFDRVIELRQGEMLPSDVFARLQQNLADNTARTRGMIAELSAIHREFQRAALRYAVLKGFSLCPCSVPRPELRSQLDLDFLVAEESALEARRILEARDFHLRAISGRSWEFKKNEMSGISLKDLYKDTPRRSVELHIEASANKGAASLLARAEMRRFRNIDMPVLSPLDLFLGQGMHAFKHICSEFSRTAHLLEFRRHVIARHDDEAFWSELRIRSGDTPRAAIELGVITLLITHGMGAFAPASFTSWTVDRVPARARLWVQLYGRRTVFASFPGSKLYLLLQKELVTSVPATRSMRQALFPLRLPPLIVHAKADETLCTRLRRYRTQVGFIFFRLRFHIVEGFRYLRESLRWQQYVNGVTP